MATIIKMETYKSAEPSTDEIVEKLDMKLRLFLEAIRNNIIERPDEIVVEGSVIVGCLSTLYLLGIVNECERDALTKYYTYGKYPE